jgi:Ase1/PRC1/MAP65 family protein
VELDRLRKTLEVRMIELCAAKRVALETLWDEAGVSQKERSLCAAYAQQLASEEALAALSHEIAEATKYVESIRPVLRAIQRWEEVWQRKIDFEKRSNDPTRLLARDPGRLLREEKERKSIDKLLPRAEKEVRILLQRWETQFDRPFLYRGHRYLVRIGEMKVEEEERKSLEKERRVGAR